MAAPALIVQMGATYLYVPLLDIFPRHYLEGRKDEFLKLLGRTVVGIIVVGAICFVALGVVGSGRCAFCSATPSCPMPICCSRWWWPR